MSKETKSLIAIEKSFTNSKRPAVLWSGGKDSTVLLDLARRLRRDIEVIHWKLPFLPQKYEFHHSEQERLGMTVHDWPPFKMALKHGNNRIDVLETYKIGSGEITICRGTEPFEEGNPWICGKDWFHRPSAETVSYFDTLLCGHKNDDIDPLTGNIPLHVDIKMIGMHTQMWFPMRDWTDLDVANYIKENDLKYDKNRYDENIVSKPDKHMNSDYVHSCLRCLDKREGEFVHCPKLKMDIENISKLIVHDETKHKYFGGQS